MYLKPRNKIKLASTVNAAMDDVTFENPTFDPDGPGEDDNYVDLPDPHPPPRPVMEPPFDVQVELNTSGNGLLFLRDELRQEGLEAQKKRLVDTFYNEVSHTYDGLRPEGRIDYSQFGSDPDGKTLYWTPEDKKISIVATRGKFRFLGLETLAGRYGLVAHMHCGDQWGSLVIDRGHRGGSADRSWRHSRAQRKPSPKTLNPSS